MHTTFKLWMLGGCIGQAYCFTMLSDQMIVAHKALSLLHPHDPMSFVLAGEAAVQQSQARLQRIEEEVGISAAVHEREMYAVRTRRMNEEIQKHLHSNPTCDQVLILKAGMDTRAYTLPCLHSCDVYEVDEKLKIQVKEHLIDSRGRHIQLKAASVSRVSHRFDDVNEDDMTLKLYRAGFNPRKPAVFVMEGTLKDMRTSCAMQLLKMPLLTQHSMVVFDIKQTSFIREPESWMQCQGYSNVHFRRVLIEHEDTWIISATTS
jgi:methyltransferase (TIGR00027 family)